MTTKNPPQRTGQAGQHDTLAIEPWPVERPIPYERNPRVVPKAAIEKVAASIASFGFRQPIVVDGAGVVIVGHTRLAAARKLGLTTVPVHVARGLSPAQVKAYRLADNRSAQESDWDVDLLGIELQDLADLGLELDLTGFDSDELAVYLGPQAGLTDPDFVPAAAAQGRCEVGDLWGLGDHRLLCGDATDGACVTRLMAGVRASAMVTDPPYLVNYDGGNHPPTKANGGKRPGAPADAGTRHWDSYVDHAAGVQFYEAFLTAARDCALTTRPAIYSFFGMMRAPLVFEAWERAGLLLHQVLVWQKSRIVLSRSDYSWDYEPLAYGWVKGVRPLAARRPPAGTPALWRSARLSKTALPACTRR